ncbi:MAG: hypothetical protein J07HX64_01013 [halophilic archaeon J07HX64]|nr:MAG: hypothetical protein J07HX64_01013 [halophilic archaeon J07HX64]
MSFKIFCIVPSMDFTVAGVAYGNRDIKWIIHMMAY